MKLNKLFVALFSVLSLLLHSCNDDDSQNLTVEKEIKFQKITLKDIKNSKQNKSGTYSKVLETVAAFKSKHSNSNRDATMNDYYVDENNGSYIENNGTQTFTFPVYDLTTENQNIENLVVTITSDGNAQSAIVKYDLTGEDLKNDLSPEQATPISVTGKVMENNNICMILFCDNSGHGTAGASHIAGEGCYNTNFLFYVYVYVGGSGTAGSGSSGTNTGGTTTPTPLPGTGATGNGTSGTSTTGVGTPGGGTVTTPVAGTLSEKQVNFLRDLGVNGNEFMQLNYTATGPVINYINTATNSQVNAALYFFNNQVNYLWMVEQKAQNQASILNFLISNNFSSTSINYLNQMINLASNNGLSFGFNNTLNTSNSLSFSSIDEIQNYLDTTEGTNQAEISYEQQNPNEKIALVKLDVSTLFDMSVKVKQELRPYKVLNVTSNLSGLTIGQHWEQDNYSVNIVGNVVTIDIVGTLAVSITQGGIGTFFERDERYTIKIDKLTGEVFATFTY